jgi:hypothetical protein
MIALASSAASRAVMYCSGCGIPAASVKCVPVRPSRFTKLFIICTKVGSVPATCSASASVASLPDWTIMPCSRFSTEICLPTSMYIAEPPSFGDACRQAFSLTVTMSSSLMRPSLSAWNTT